MDNLDSRLLNREQEERQKKEENTRAENLREARFQSRQESEQDVEPTEKQTYIERLRQAIDGTNEAVRNIAFSSFTIMLVLAIFKDLTDIPACTFSLCTAGTLSNFVISSLLFLFRLWIWIKTGLTITKLKKSNSTAASIIENLLASWFIKFAAVTLVEYIPLTNWFPTWTIYIISLKFQNSNIGRILMNNIEKNKKLLKKLGVHA